MSISQRDPMDSPSRRAELVLMSVWEFVGDRTPMNPMPWVKPTMEPEYDPEAMARLLGYHDAIREIQELIISKSEELITGEPEALRG